MSYLVDSTSFNEAWFQLELLIIQTCLVVFLYGIYVHFFVSAIRNLSRRNNRGRLPLLTATWVMLLFATIQLLLQIGGLAISARLLQSIVTDPAAAEQPVSSLDTLDKRSVIEESGTADLARASDCPIWLQPRSRASCTRMWLSFSL
ncbi:hypothetical protein FB45DRAFT_531063 [Roridomyces roridus]|uniref:Uncharacterized protein n=1 Tax=Roridomyces roridus TaxID=1738132 RepID=A0AAD7BU47_9AGAR|nr:hypothetical protein FB45DRAFT_531063 [Roridomyces roridus]